ncbi:MAG: phosphate/phosphite/phosphonate ABC transporter substrate-binding protein, partial [Limisphaerales bacterium]
MNIRTPNPEIRFPLFVWAVAPLLAVALLVAAPARSGAIEEADPAGTRTELRFAFSKSMFVGVNENDAKAALKVYAQTIGDQNGVHVSSAPELLEGTNAIAKAIKNKQADLFVLTAGEFFALENLGLEGPLLLAKIRDNLTEDYLLLASEDSPLRKLEDLKGRSLTISSDARSSLATLWLEVQCREQGLGSAMQLLAKVTFSAKITQVVLPVFFGKADACIVTRASWEVMCELNPQLRKRLRIVAVSPSVVPAVTCFRGGFTETAKRQVLRAVDLSSTKPSYKQLMAMFKTEGLGQQPLSVLEGTRAL